MLFLLLLLHSNDTAYILRERYCISLVIKLIYKPFVGNRLGHNRLSNEAGEMYVHEVS